MQIFKTNEFFCGLSIPDPGTIDPIEKKLPRDIAGADGVDFMKVSIAFESIFIFNDSLKSILNDFPFISKISFHFRNV